VPGVQRGCRLRSGNLKRALSPHLVAGDRRELSRHQPLLARSLSSTERQHAKSRSRLTSDRCKNPAYAPPRARRSARPGRLTSLSFRGWRCYWSCSKSDLSPRSSSASAPTPSAPSLTSSRSDISRSNFNLTAHTRPCSSGGTWRRTRASNNHQSRHHLHRIPIVPDADSARRSAEGPRSQRRRDCIHRRRTDGSHARRRHLHGDRGRSDEGGGHLQEP
jgi:hypothetical protein